MSTETGQIQITTPNGSKARTRFSEALGQAENVIADLSCNTNADSLIVSMIDMLDDDRARKIIIIADGKAVLYKK